MHVVTGSAVLSQESHLHRTLVNVDAVILSEGSAGQCWGRLVEPNYLLFFLRPLASEA